MMLPPDNDNEFDDLIRQAGDKYNPSGAAPDWDQMGALLDKHMPVKERPRRRIFFFLLIPLCLLLAGTYFYFSTGSKNIKNGQGQPAAIKRVDPPSSSSLSVEPAKEINTGKDIAKVQTPVLTGKNKVSPVDNALSSVPSGKAFINTGIRRNKNHSKRPSDLAAVLLQREETASTREEINRVQTSTIGKSHIKTYLAETGEDNPSNDSANNPASPGKAATEKNNATVVGETPITEKGTDTTTNNQSAKKTTAPPVTTKENKTADSSKKTTADKKNKTSKNRFEFSLLYAPELTTIEFSHIDKPGSNYGLLFGYRLWDNFTIQTGVIRSRKNYTADGYDFTLRRPMPTGTKLTEVSGYCRMYEIPINIKSSIIKRKNFNFFYTAGISSYIMTGESYDYYYSTPYGDSSRNAKFTTQNNYWLALGTLGLGLEKDITNNLSVSVSPFLKVPFRGMGRGNLKLMSTGVNFLLTYKPFRLKK